MMHTSAKASLQADSSIDIFWKSMKIDVKSRQNGPHFGPWCALGSFRGSKVTQEPLKATQKGPQEGSRAPLGTPRDVPRASTGSHRAPRRSPRALIGGLGKGKIEKKSVTEAKKVNLSKSAPRLAPADARSTLDPFKPLQNRPRMVQSAFLSRLGVLFGQLWLLKSGLGVLGDRFGSTPKPQSASKGAFLDFS